MADVNQSDISIAQVCCQTEKCKTPAQNPKPSMNDLGSKILTRPSEEKDNHGCEGGNSTCVDEHVHSWSGDVTKDSLPTQFCPCSEVRNNQSRISSDHHQILSEDTHKSGSENVKGNLSQQAQNDPVRSGTLVSSCFDKKQHLLFSENGVEDPLAQVLEQIHESLEQEPNYSSEIELNQQTETSSVVSSCCIDKRLQSVPENMIAKFSSEESRLHYEDPSKISQLGSGDAKFAPRYPNETKNLASNDIAGKVRPKSEVGADCSRTMRLRAAKNSNKQLEPPSKDVPLNSSIEKSGLQCKKAVKNSQRLPKKTVKKLDKSYMKKKYVLRSKVGNDIHLRSREDEKVKAPVPSKEPSNIVQNVSRKGKKGKEKIDEKGKNSDEFSRIRRHLRYLLNRMGYEQNFINAYSAEGWKGQSAEKLKPEKELQRATSEILRRKLKVRELFQRLDSICGEGRLPESVFDSEGEIDSEDIFCAKCGTKELSTDNDIILCDGACDCAFHQFCLQPPLLNEDIPPDDEGWLCPACDCKVDCMDLLNDYQGTNLLFTDSWEKVYPEAASSQNPEGTSGLPSDDSADSDYDPDGPQLDSPKEESSSDESDYASVAEELETTQPKADLYSGLPSDDSEDDNYDPSAPDLDDYVKQESSSSDFTSDSEDLAGVIDDDGSSRNNDGSNGRGCKSGRKIGLLADELLSILDSGPGLDGSLPVSGNRHVERLDYKKLHDAAYGNIASDSSDDEDFSDTAAPIKRSSRKVAQVSQNRNGANVQGTKHELKEIEQGPTRRTRQKPTIEDINDSKTKSPEDPSKSCCTGKGTKSAGGRGLGETVIQKLYASFNENQYPDRAKKERLAQDIGITFKQVHKWFLNTRWSTRHSPAAKAKVGESSATAKETPTPLKSIRHESSTPTRSRERKGISGSDARVEETPKAEVHSPAAKAKIGEIAPTSKETPTSQKSIRQESSTPTRSRKRKGISDSDARVEETPKAEVKTSVRVQTRRRKSAS